MSEIKGQLLGLVLVLGIFALVGGILYAVFGKTANRISDQVDSAVGVAYVEENFVA